MKELINDIERIAKALPHMSRFGIESLASELLDIADRMRDELEDARFSIKRKTNHIDHFSGFPSPQKGGDARLAYDNGKLRAL